MALGGSGPLDCHDDEDARRVNFLGFQGAGFRRLVDEGGWDFLGGKKEIQGGVGFLK